MRNLLLIAVLLAGLALPISEASARWGWRGYYNGPGYSGRVYNYGYGYRPYSYYGYRPYSYGSGPYYYNNYGRYYNNYGRSYYYPRVGAYYYGTGVRWY